ncbi:MAG: hypothetical protein NUV64_02420, partial [Parcubacteria group bacterium]|nr:hypothetical protein [Parcubacteria group bacterium]MCR4343084.1 hypothetical protein [Patescibacteria group bacterium]
MKTVILIFHAFRDLSIRRLPRFKKQGGFAFLVHPRDIKDVYRKYPFASFFSEKWVKKFLKFYWPI